MDTRSPITCDVAVVGGGPAGASAARITAAAGLQTILLEKANPPRYKTCGGGISGRAAVLIGDPLAPVTEQACHRAQFVLSERLRFTASRDRPIIVMTMRDALDAWLMQKATAAGAQLISNCTVMNVATDPQGVTLSTSGQGVRAKFVIAADGASSTIARKCGWPGHRVVVPALECEVKVSAADFSRLNQSARFDIHVVPHGYAWVFPKQSHLSIGVLTYAPHLVNLKQCFEKYLACLGIDTPLSIERHGYVIPLSPREGVLARDNVLLTGDAAGFADPITAEGIANAIYSGQLAARAIVSAFPRRQEVMSLYSSAVEREILPELRWATRLARLLYGMPRLRDSLFRWKGQALTELMTEVVAGNENYRCLLTRPGNYFKLLHARPGKHPGAI